MDEIQSALKIFINEVHEKSNRKPIIYKDLSTENLYINNTYFSNHALGIANHHEKKSLRIPDT